MKNIRNLKDSRRGERAFILGNGPSILDTDLSCLKGELVIGMNGSPLLEEQFDFHASHYALSDARFLNNPDKHYVCTSALKNDVVRVLRYELQMDDDPEQRDRTHYVRSMGKNGYSFHLCRGYYFGCTTSMLALQLASYIGSKEIYLLGMDFKYTAENRRFYEEKHPDPVDPFLSVQLWNMRNAYQLLKERGVSVAMCSKYSNLRPYLPYQEFNDLF